MGNIKVLRELQEQYTTLRQSSAVESIQLNSTAGAVLISNRNVINTLLDTLIAETQKQLTEQIKEQ